VEDEEEEEGKQGQEMARVEEEVEACRQVVEAILNKGRKKGESSSSSSNEGKMPHGEEEAASSQDVRGELKRLSKRIKAAIGVKVMNKIIRNREE
jgi:hypothetical protein